MEITKREIIVSIAIIAVMLIIGFIISGKIIDYQNDKNAEYQKAIHITDTELFQYGMETNVGNGFVYGDLKAVDTVTFDEIDGEYLYVEKVKQKYTQHTRITYYTDSSGKMKSKKETYWTWDTVGTEEKKCKEISFCGIVFGSSKIVFPNSEYIDTIKESSRIRYKYYGVSTTHTGTIYTILADNTISDNSKFYENYTIDKALKSCTSGGGIIAFWISWILLIGVCIYGFCYLDNRWLED